MAFGGDVTQTNNLQVTITSQDALAATYLNRLLGQLSFVGVAGVFNRLKIPNANTAVTLPVSPAKQVYVRNNDAASNLTVIWTPNGGASATVAVLTPGSCLLLWDITGAGNGITALSLNQSVAATEVEYFIGG